ncbi:MAG: glycoside hydrolase family 3 N-terminal domain-containing protein, partial [Anaerolineales bacterium]
MSQMSPAERVGQLVLVSFPGVAPDLDSEIAALIRDYGIGGVILRPANGNFGVQRIDPLTLISMTNQLQSLAEQASQAPSPSNERGDEKGDAFYIPLFVATPPSAEGLPLTAYISQTTSLPTPMALGATWDETLAETAGYVMGRELSVLGINLFLGPDLDVMLTPRPGDLSDLGTRVFGSHPFWVGELGRAYIQGMHQGSEQRMLVVPRHLPGLGGADRSVSEEIPTIQKSLAELEQNELAPFFAAMEEDPGADLAADGVLVTHNRYRGFEGNIRISTQPISLDAQALQLLMELEQVADWREAGGVLVSDNLGLRSIREFYNPEGTSFNARRVVQEALIAGNDLLILDKFSADGEWTTHFANVRDTLEFLTALYESDTTFQSIVDEAVYRVLQMKLRAFPEFSLPAVSVAPGEAEAILAEERSVGAQTAMNALTLIFPLSEDLLPSPPREDETMVIFTQEYDVQSLAGGPALPLLQQDTLSRAIQRFYGPQGTGVIELGTIQSFTFSQLRRALETGPQPVVVEPPPASEEPEEPEGSEVEGEAGQEEGEGEG